MTVKKDSTRTYVSLSFSCPPEMEQAINRRTVDLGFHSRSDYLRKLFERDLIASGLFDPRNPPGQVPPRIRRGRQPKAKKK
jgi:hypothetical protein